MVGAPTARGAGGDGEHGGAVDLSVADGTSSRAQKELDALGAGAAGMVTVVDLVRGRLRRARASRGTS
ncbi:MAG TPA: hypothetical protein VN621_08815 [Arthrobacter sp.]|nr:hypothetical protein [Arthrobacter sp.]